MEKDLKLGDTVFIITDAVDQNGKVKLNGAIGIVESITDSYNIEVRLGKRLFPFSEFELHPIPSKVQRTILRNLWLKGVPGRSFGSMGVARRERVMQNLIDKGWLHKNGGVSPRGAEVSAPFFNPKQFFTLKQ